MSRIVVGQVAWAKRCAKPAAIGKSRPRGAKAQGLRYEKLVAKAMPFAVYGPWFEFFDGNGYGYCQPDLLIIESDRVIVLECKLSDYYAGYSQIERLYKPVLRTTFSRPVVGAVICKVLRSDAPKQLVCASLSEALGKSQGVPLIHWLGRWPGHLAHGKDIVSDRGLPHALRA